MNIIISPAKKMRTETDLMETGGIPLFLTEADRLRALLAGYTREELKKLFAANDSITDLNYRRYQEMNLRAGGTPAVLSYVGLQYQSMAPDVLSRDGWEYLCGHLKILSGLYGLLRASDGVVPYRLEMQAKLPVGGKKDLYGYWGDRLYRELTREDPVILNLASKEYSKAVEPFVKKPARIITCIFGSLLENRVKVKGTLAKMARGDMVRWLAENQIHDPEQVKEYKGMDYRFEEGFSTEDTFVFLTQKKKEDGF